MNILTQAFENIYNQEVSQLLQEKVASYIAPMIFEPSSLEYGELISQLSMTIHSMARDILKQTFEEMDEQFRNSPGRTNQYYIKQTRNRTIMTLFGEVTYRRTEYINRQTNKPYCYVDRKIKLKSRERYDCTIKSLVMESYADQNSMIKVGKIIGNRIANSYSLDSRRTEWALPRQTVFNILNSMKKIVTPPTVMKESPEILYVMADEKYVPVQEERTIDNKYPKVMIKAGVIFEGRTIKSKGKAKTPRYELENCHYYASTGGTFWERMHDILNMRYDLSKVKQIYVLGDGAPWIKEGASELATGETKTKFALDKFHACQAIQKITRDKDTATLLTQYMFTNMKKDFEKLIETIKEDNPSNLRVIEEKSNYILNHWGAIQVMHTTIPVGCAMEQAIAHVLASVFTSVPKAYSRDRIETYVGARINHQNNLDLRKLYLIANDIEETDDDFIEIKSDDLDFSMFDTSNNKTTYQLNLNHQSFEEITKF